MIDIVYDKRVPSVTVRGHAESAPEGQDTVCAAISALTYTLAADVCRLGCENLVRLQKGDAVISCTPPPALRSVADYLFESICVGFEIISRDYPKNVRYEIVKG
ncbi:MAG: ribosomal-processing cysteine protease Prp [Clostridia bacterium]|nr:ribosomal-processing cysteine protease Prp [Clostridia bacterium]